MFVATEEQSLQRVCDEYESDSAATGVGLAKQLVESQSNAGVLVRKLCIAGKAESSAAVVGKLLRVLTGDRRRQVRSMLGCTVSQIRIVRFAVYCGRGMVTCLEGEAQDSSPSQ